MKERTVNIKSALSFTKNIKIFIEGDADLILNKMNARNERLLMSPDRKKVKEVPNIWEDLITSIHWRDGIPVKDTYTECTEGLLDKMLEENAPCISAVGLKKTFCEAVYRNNMDKSTKKFDSTVNIIAPRNLVPVTFTEYFYESKLMSPKRGAPIVVQLNHFMGWKAEIDINYSEHVWDIEQIITAINLAGFGIGIGSGRTSGYGRYHVIGAK